METLNTFLPLTDSTIGYCTDMAEPSIDIDGQEDKNCDLKINSSSTITHDLEHCLSDNSESVDCAMEDVQMFNGSVHSRCENTSSLENISHGVACDSKEQESVIDEAKTNDIADYGSVPYIQNVDTKTQPDPEPQCLDSSSLSNVCNSPSTDQSSALLIPKQTTSSSKIVSHGNTAESDLTVANRDDCTLSAINFTATESFGKDYISDIKPASAKSFGEDEIVSGIKLTCESNGENETVSGIKPTIAESFGEDDIVSDLKPTSAESFEEDKIVSDIMPTSSESFGEDEIVSGIKPTSAESFGNDEIVSDIKPTSAESFGEDEIVSGIKPTSAKSIGEDEIVSCIKPTSAESFGVDEIVSSIKPTSTELFGEKETVSGIKPTSAESLGDEIVSGIKPTSAESLGDEIVSGIKPTSAESFGQDEIVSDVKSTSTESLGKDEIVSGITSTSAESFGEDEIVSGITFTSAESFGEDEIVSGIKPTSAESFGEDAIVSGINSTSAESFGEDEIVSGIKSTGAESFGEDAIVFDIKPTGDESFGEDIISAIKPRSTESFDENQSAADVSHSSLDGSINMTICSQECSPEMTNVESVAEPIYDDNSLQADCFQEHEGNSANCRTASENEDIEDMQVEEHQMMAKIEDCFTISDTEMDCFVPESEAAESDEAEKLNEMDETTVSALKSDPVSLSDSCNVLPSQCEREQIETHSSPEQDVNSVDESAPIDEVYLDKDSHITDDICDIRIADSRSVGGDFSEYSASNEIICLEESDTEQEKVPKEINLNCNESAESGHNLTLLVNNYSEQAEQLNSTYNSKYEISDQRTVENISENLDKTTSEIVCKSQETKLELGGDKNNHDLDMKVNISSTENEKCVTDQSCELTNAHSYNCAPDKTTKNQADQDESYSCIAQTSDKSTEDNASMVQNKAHEINKTCAPLCETDRANDKLSYTEHSKIVSADYNKDYEKESSTSCKEAKSDIKIVKSVDRKETVDNKCETKDLFTDSKVGHLDKVTGEKPLKEEQKLSSKDKTYKAENTDEDDEVVFVDEAGKSKPVDSSDEKDLLKNILNASKSSSDIDRIVIDENECLASSKSVTEPPIESKKLIAQQSGQSIEMTANLVLEELDEQMEIISSIEKSRSSEPHVGGGRKRTQTEDDAFSASKRSRLDLTEDKLENQSKEKPKETILSEVLDSDDDVILEEEVPAMTAKHEETIKSTDNSMVVLSSEALKNLIALRVRAFLKTQKQTNLDKLNLRTRGMQSASNLWRETAKHLEKSISSLAALNQTLQKHKKQLESRSVGIQVGGEKQSPFQPVVNGTYNRVQETAPSSVGHNSLRSISMNSSHTPQPIRQQIQSSPSSNPALRNPALVTQPPAMRMQNRPGRPTTSFSLSPNTLHTSPQRPAMTPPGRMPQSPLVRPPTAPQSMNNVVNLIDLTDDDDSIKIITRAPKFTPSQQGTPKLMMGGKTTGNNMKPGSTSQGFNGQIHHSPAAGSQYLTSSRAGASSNSPYHLATITNSASSLGLVPGSRPGAPPNTSSIVPGKSNQSNKRALPQNSSQNGPSPAKAISLPPSFHISNKHPAPLPTGMDAGNAPLSAKRRPPKPGLKISRVSQGIVLSWNMPPLVNVEKITSYQLFAYQESDSTIPKSSLWKKVGDVKALPLPMACTLTQFQEGNKYHFAVRAVDQYGRWGSYSDPSSIFLGSKT